MITPKGDYDNRCQYKYSDGVFCAQEYFLHAPKPGAQGAGSPKERPELWLKLCRAHYQEFIAQEWREPLLQHHMAKLEAKYGKFEDHRGKDMAKHCLKIMRELGDIGKMAANALEKRIKQ